MQNKKNIETINFEEFVINPEKYLIKIEKKISLKKNKKLLYKIFKESGIPRKKINYGIYHVDYALKKQIYVIKKIYLREMGFIKKK